MGYTQNGFFLVKHSIAVNTSQIVTVYCYFSKTPSSAGQLLDCDQVLVGEFVVADCDDIVENCRIQLEKTILQMQLFVIPGFTSTPEMVNYQI